MPKVKRVEAVKAFARLQYDGANPDFVPLRGQAWNERVPGLFVVPCLIIRDTPENRRLLAAARKGT